MMKMMTIEEIKKQKEVLGLTNQELADLANVPLSTVGKVLGGTTKRPRIDTVRALEQALKSRGIEGPEKKKPEENKSEKDDTGKGSREMLCEPQGQYIFGTNADQERIFRSNENKPASAEEGSGAFDETDRLHGYSVRCGNEEYEAEAHRRENSLFTEPLHTIEDYLALPDERRVEMIDGHYYDMASPTGIHQQISLLIWRELFQCIEDHGMPCSVQAAAFDVQLDLHTIVQPDVMVFCRDPSQAFAVRATTPPDLVIEVLSRSTAFRDRHLKLFKYRQAGVKEVWLVSPEKRTVEVYLFENGEEPEIYTFDGKVPVHLSQGRCAIDFSGIRRRIPGL